MSYSFPCLCVVINAPNSINTNINSTKFLGLTLDVSLSWKDHIAALTSKLNKACYAIRSMKPLLSTDILRMIYFSYAHSTMAYGIIFWGNTPSNKNIFKIQKTIIRIIAKIGNRESCRQAFFFIVWNCQFTIYSQRSNKQMCGERQREGVVIHR